MAEITRRSVDGSDFSCRERSASTGGQDARQYAAWGVDYLKYDWCSTGSQDAKSSYETMSDALRASGRPIVFSICEWGKNQPWLWGETIGNLWRMSGDIYDGWESRDGHYNGMTNILDMQVGLESYAGPGHWNDPDMLEVGNGGMSFEEYKSHFSLWAVHAAPLVAGNDLATMTPETKAILTNKEVIAIDQDPLGVQASRVAKHGDYEVWARPLKGGGRAVVLLNRSKASHSVTVTWDDLHLPSSLSLKVRDLWTHQDLPAAKGSFSAEVPSHGVVMVRLEEAIRLVGLAQDASHLTSFALAGLRIAEV